MPPNRIKQFAANLLLGDEVKRLTEAANLMKNAYLRGPFELPPEMLISQLKEYDSTLLWDMVMQMGYEQIGGAYTGYMNDAAERVRAVKESRRLWTYDVLAQWMIWTWTNFGFGENIEVTPLDESAIDVWDDFWYADENQTFLADDEIQSLSEELTVDGELFFVYYISTLNGKVTLRIIDPLEIADPITLKTDKYTKVLYKRQYTNARGAMETLYYPDISILNSDDPVNYDEFFADANLSGGDILTDRNYAPKAKAGTIAIVQHVPFNRKSRKMLRGWPLLTAGAGWIRESNKFEQHRATLAAAVAMIVNKIKVDGGSRAVKDIRSQIASTLSAANAIEGNPPPVGGTMVANKAMDMDRMPLTTGGSDSKFDRDGIGRMAALGGGLLAPWVGLGDYARLADARQMETPMYREFSRYQNFWAAQFRRMVWVVLRSDELWGNKKSYSTYEAEVSTDRLVETDLESVSKSVGTMLKDGLQPYVDNGTISQETALQILAAIWRIALQALGVEEAVDLTSEDAFKSAVPVDNTNTKPVNQKDMGSDEDTEPTEYTANVGSGVGRLQMSRKRKGKRKAGYTQAIKKLQEIIDPETKKFTPAVTEFIPDNFPENSTDITGEDVQASINHWNATKPPEYQGILQAAETKREAL